MSGKSFFQGFAVLALAAAAFVAAQPLLNAAPSTGVNAQALHQYRLTERYGDLPVQSVPQAAIRLAQFGERYGQVAAPVISPELLRLYAMGDRYGETP